MPVIHSNLPYVVSYAVVCVAQLVPAVTELIIAELLYLQYKDRQKPIFLYINSTGTTRADGETVRSRRTLKSSLSVGVMSCNFLSGQRHVCCRGMVVCFCGIPCV